MYGMPQPKPSFLRAWSMMLLVTAPVAWFAWYMLESMRWFVIVLWIGLSALGGLSSLERMKHDTRAKMWLDATKHRYRR